jgi:hypothetical protein
MVIVAAFAGDVEESFPGGSLADLVKRVAETGHVDEFLRADVEVQAEKPFELAGGNEVPFGQFADGYPTLYTVDRFDQRQGLLGRDGETVCEPTIEVCRRVGGGLGDWGQKTGVELDGLIGGISQYLVILEEGEATGLEPDADQPGRGRPDHFLKAGHGADQVCLAGIHLGGSYFGREAGAGIENDIDASIG